MSQVKKTKPASLAGAQGRDMGATCMEVLYLTDSTSCLGLSRLLGPHDGVVDDTSTVVGGKYVLYPGGECGWGHGKKGVLGTEGHGQSRAIGYARGTNVYLSCRQRWTL